MAITIWDRILGATLARKAQMIELPFEWFTFENGINVRQLPAKDVPKLLLKEDRYYFEAIFENAKIDVHQHDFNEGWYIITGTMKDNLSGNVLTAGQFKQYYQFDLHEPEAEYCHMIVTVD